MIDGVAAAAAVRTWPFRVFSFPSQIKIANAIPVDFGYWNYEYAGIPIIEDTSVPPGKIFFLNHAYITSPASMKALQSSLSLRLRGSIEGRVKGLECPIF